MESLEKLPNNLKQWLLETAQSFGVSDDLLPFVSCALTITPILLFFPLLFALTTIFERKGLARIQNRYGPNRVGPYGFLQFVADGIKSLTKEDVVPERADKLLHFLAPVVLAVPVVLTFAVIPFGRHLVPIQMEAGLLFFFAVGGMAELAIFMAGWSSRNKYSLLGAMRAIAQMISYEVPLILAAVVVVMLSGSLNPVEIVARQQTDHWAAFAGWNILSPWGLLAFVLFSIAMLAEANRSPFDLPEGESELVAGYFTEYSGFKFALFFMAEYLGLFAAMGMCITLFLGGWSPPLNLPPFTWLPTWIWFALKLLLGIFLVIWIRGTMPRIRMDQLMNFAWKFMLPLGLLNILLVGFLTAGPPKHWVVVTLEWIFAALLIFVAWIVLAEKLANGKVPGPRKYRYAE